MFDIITTNDSFNEVLLGAIVGGAFTLIGSIYATNKAHKNNLAIQQEEQEREERAVILSIIEEIKVLLELYIPSFDEMFNELNINQYLTTYIMVTQDFMTIYSNNSNNIGLIKDKELRHCIIKTYTILKKFIEDLNIYRILINEKEKDIEYLSYKSKILNDTYNSLRSSANNTIKISEEIYGTNND